MEDFTNYDIAKLLISAHLSALTSKEIQSLIPSNIDITNRVLVQRTLRHILIPQYASNPRYKLYFSALSRAQVARLLQIPTKELTHDLYTTITA